MGATQGPFLCLAGDTGPSRSLLRCHPVTNGTTSSSGLIVGGLGGAEDELLEDGQEEVFSRTEVEAGRMEHAVKAGSDSRVSDDPTEPSDR